MAPATPTGPHPTGPLASGPAAPAPEGAGRHYGWVVMGVGVLVMFACLGLARFSFGILLPPMAQALDLSYAQRGYLGTGYFVGYLAMVALAPALSRRVGHRAAIGLGLGGIALSMGLLGVAGGYYPALFCYVVTGMGSGAANISMMAVVAAWFAPTLRGLATGTVIGGNGLGIILSGFLVPAVVVAANGFFADGGAEPVAMGWRAGWVVLAGIVGLVCCLASLLIRNRPSDKDLHPVGHPAGLPDATPRPAPPAPERKIEPRDKGFLLFLGVVYFLFGFTYIIYATFIATTLVDEYGFAQDVAGRFWAWVGFFSLFSGPVLGRVSDRVSRRAGLMCAFAIQATAYLLAALGQGSLPLYASVALFGLAAWSVPTIMTATVADRLGPARTASGFALITLVFAVGQIAGPTTAGWLADWTGGFRAAYLLSAGMAGAAVLLSFFVRVRRGV